MTTAVEEASRVCVDCTTRRSIEDFRKYKSKAPLGYNRYKSCRVCQNKKAKSRHRRNMLDPVKREKKNKYQRERFRKKYAEDKDFREKRIKDVKRNYDENREEILAHVKVKLRRQKNRDQAVIESHETDRPLGPMELMRDAGLID